MTQNYQRRNASNSNELTAPNALGDYRTEAVRIAQFLLVLASLVILAGGTAVMLA